MSLYRCPVLAGPPTPLSQLRPHPLSQPRPHPSPSSAHTSLPAPPTPLSQLSQSSAWSLTESKVSCQCRKLRLWEIMSCVAFISQKERGGWGQQQQFGVKFNSRQCSLCLILQSSSSVAVSLFSAVSDWSLVSAIFYVIGPVLNFFFFFFFKCSLLWLPLKAICGITLFLFQLSTKTHGLPLRVMSLVTTETVQLLCFHICGLPSLFG